MRSPITLPNRKNRYQVLTNDKKYAGTRINVSRKSFTLGLLAVCVILSTFNSAYTSAHAADVERVFTTTTAAATSHDKTVIDVRSSPSVYLPGPGFRIDVYSTKPVSADVTDFLRNTIERSLLQNDPRLRIDTGSPDTSITFIITDLTVTQHVETRTTLEYQKTGEISVYDSVSGTYHTEDQYGYVNVPYRAQVIDAQINVKCEVSDVATGILLYVDNFGAAYTTNGANGGYGGAQVDLGLIYLKLVNKVTEPILAQLSPRAYSEVVALPSGKLKDASKLLFAGEWSEALSLVTSMAQFKDSKDEAYRWYCIGVAEEALAYKTQNVGERKTQLERAVESYRRAAELKPKEDMFWAPKNRAELELSQSSGLVAQLEAFDKAKKAGVNGTSLSATDLLTRTKSNLQSSRAKVNNQTVIQLAKAGHASDFIIATIKHAPSTEFDLSEAERLKLRREGVRDDVLKAMKESQVGRRPSVLGKTLVSAAAMLWWLPFILR